MKIRKISIIALAFVAFTYAVWPQTTAFKYQGSLTDGGTAATGNFQMQFKLFDAFSGGSQIGSTLNDVPVTAMNGVFSVSLDFGANALSGANRWLEIAVRRNSGEIYVTLSPREQIASAPYAVRTLTAAQADTALDSQKLGGVNASQFVQTNDTRLSDARTPLAGSSNYIQNQNSGPQPSSNFNISGTATASSFNINGPLTFGNLAAPPVAPAGQGRFYFDTATNKLRVSENGNAYVNLVGATGLSGSGSLNRIPLFSAATTLGDSNLFQSGANIGIGVTPQSRFHSGGTGWFSGDSTPLPAAAGKGLAIGFAAEQGYLFGFDYATFSPKNLIINHTGGSVGVGTSTPHPLFRLDSLGSVRASANTHVNFTVETSGTNNGARVNMRSATRNWFIGTSQSLNSDQFYIGEGDSLTAGQRMVITTGGTFGFGTINPHLGYRADFLGGVRSTDSASTQFVVETTGGTNAWARYYMRSVNPDGTIHRSWLIGTSRNFNGDQFYLVDETSNLTRFAITPNDGPVFLQGNVTGSSGGRGLPKAMLMVLANGSISHCYNGITGQTINPCGFSVLRNVIPGVGPNYSIDLGFAASGRFVSLIGEGSSNFSGRISNRVGNFIVVRFHGADPNFTQDSDFHVIVY